MTRPTPLVFLSPGWFSVVMGVSGLGLAWLGATPLLGELARGVGVTLTSVAALVGVALVVASVLRWQRHPQALADDLKHPVRHAFVAAAPVSLLLLATAALHLALPTAWIRPLWWTGSLLQLWATWWVLGRWLRAPLPQAPSPWPMVTPVLFVPVVGNVVAPLAGVGLGHETWSAAQMGIGVLFWPVVLTLTLVRRLAHGPMPDRLLPTWFITVAPPAVIGLCLLQFQAPLWQVQACWGMALFFLAWVAGLGKRLVEQPFGLPFWALSFPLAALTNLTLQLWQRQPSAPLQLASLLLLALCSLVILGLSLATWRGWRSGTLLAPEPVANLVPVATL